MRTMRAVLLLLVVSLCASCNLARKRTYSVRVINVSQDAVDCVVVVDDQLHVDDSNEPVRTPADVTLTFEYDDTREAYRSMKLDVKSILLDDEGKIVQGLREGETGPYLEDSRSVHYDDAKVQLFILRRR